MDIVKLNNLVKSKLEKISEFISVDSLGAGSAKVRACYQILAAEIKKFSTEREILARQSKQLSELNTLMELETNKTLLEMDNFYLRSWLGLVKETCEGKFSKVTAQFKEFYFNFAGEPEKLAMFVFEKKETIEKLNREINYIKQMVSSLENDLSKKETKEENKLASTLSRWDIRTPLSTASQAINSLL